MPGSREHLWLLLAPLPATAVRLVVAQAYGVSWIVYAPNIGGAVVGIVLFYIVQRVAPRTVP